MLTIIYFNDGIQEGSGGADFFTLSVKPFHFCSEYILNSFIMEIVMIN